jgi:type IV secretion system protein VirB8
MGMGAIMEKLIGTKEVADMTPDQKGDWYLEQAMVFERSKVQAERDSKKIAWRCFAGSMVLTGLTVIVSAVLVFNNKPNPPAIMQVHDNGEVTMLKTLSDGKITYGQATDISYLRKYIAYRESYDWETIQDFYNATLLLSSVTEGNVYASFNAETNPMAPVNVLKDKFRVIANAGTISFVGDTALVSFSKKTIPLNGAPPTIEYFVATVSYKYENQPMDDKDRGINVAGWKAQTYQVARDLTKSAAVTASVNKHEESAP